MVLGDEEHRECVRMCKLYKERGEERTLTVGYEIPKSRYTMKAGP